MTELKTVFFDLDGTLADTAPDLARAINALLREHDRPTLAYDTIRPVVSNGSTGLLKLAFGVSAEDAGYAALRMRLLEIYAAELCLETRLFRGIPEVLAEIGRRGMQWGVVTNKPAHLTEPLMRALNPVPAPASIVSGDSTAKRKPHPDPMLLACEQTGSLPAECLYVGDAERDIQAGRDAGMRTLVALFGYIGKQETPERWGADGMIRNPRELLDWIDAR